MAKKQLGYTETDKKENFAKFYTTTFSDIPNAAKQALANPLAWDALPDIAQAIDLEKAGYMTVENGYTVHQTAVAKWR
jgi:hypothetical protein